MAVGVVLGWGSATVQDIARIIGLGFDVLAIVPDDDAAARHMGQQLAGLCPVEDQQNLRRRQRELTGILTFADDQVLNTSRLAHELGLQFQHTTRVAIRLTDKLVQRRLLAGMSNIRFFRGDVAPTNIVPAVVKPRRATGGFGIRRARSSADLKAIMASIAPITPLSSFVIEEELFGTSHPANRTQLADYVSVEICTIAGERRVFAVGDKLELTSSYRETGSIYPSALPDAWLAWVSDTALNAVASLGVESGILHVEIKLTPQGPQVIEVNGRLGGGVSRCLRLANQLDSTALAFAVAAGNTWPESMKIASLHGDRQAVAQLLIAPPDGRHVLTNVPSRAEVRKLPGVQEYTQFRRIGDVADSSSGQRSVVGEIFLAGDNPDDVLSDVSRVQDRLDRMFVFDAVEPSRPNITES